MSVVSSTISSTIYSTPFSSRSTSLGLNAHTAFMMDNIFAIAFGLSLRVIITLVSNHSLKLTGSLVGLWEGIVLLHFTQKWPKSFDPYVAYGVRLFVDFLVTESVARLALVVIWTGLGMILADIAPGVWDDAGGRRIWSRFKRDMRVLMPRMPRLAIPFMYKPRTTTVRFVSSRASSAVSNSSSTVSGPTYSAVSTGVTHPAPSVVSSTTTSTTTSSPQRQIISPTPAPRKPSRVPGHFMRDSETEASIVGRIPSGETSSSTSASGLTTDPDNEHHGTSRGSRYTMFPSSAPRDGRLTEDSDSDDGSSTTTETPTPNADALRDISVEAAAEAAAEAETAATPIQTPTLQLSPTEFIDDSALITPLPPVDQVPDIPDDAAWDDEAWEKVDREAEVDKEFELDTKGKGKEISSTPEPEPPVEPEPAPEPALAPAPTPTPAPAPLIQEKPSLMIPPRLPKDTKPEKAMSEPGWFDSLSDFVVKKKKGKSKSVVSSASAAVDAFGKTTPAARGKSPLAGEPTTPEEPVVEQVAVDTPLVDFGQSSGSVKAQSVVHSRAPSVAPSNAHSIAPSLSKALSVALSAASPTVFPKAQSVASSVAPSVAPSAAPSVNPSKARSPPSVSPPIVPPKASVAPSVVPPVSPSVAPSDAPSRLQSIAPSKARSVPPSATPPVVPPKASVAWSVAPSEALSVAPSIVPSIAPSSSPWKKASVAWPVAPSEAPSVAPSIVPSIAPSSSPWKKPLPPSRPESIAPSIPPSKSHSPKGGSKAGSAVGVGGSPIGGEGMGRAGETETPITPIPSTTIPTTTVLARTARSNDPVDRSPPPTFSQIYPDYPNGPLDRLGTGIQGLRDINTNTTNPWTGADTKEKQDEKKDEGEALGSPAGQDPNNRNEPTTMTTTITSTTPPALSTPLGDTKVEDEDTHKVDEKEKEKEVEADEKEKVEVDAGADVDEKPKVEEEQTEKVEANAEESNPNPDQDLDLDTSDIDSQSPLLPPEPTPADHLFVSLNIFKQIDQLKKAKIKAKRDRTKRAKKGEAVDEAASKEEDEGYDKELRRLERRAERVAYKDFDPTNESAINKLEFLANFKPETAVEKVQMVLWKLMTTKSQVGRALSNEGVEVAVATGKKGKPVKTAIIDMLKKNEISYNEDPNNGKFLGISVPRVENS